VITFLFLRIGPANVLMTFGEVNGGPVVLFTVALGDQEPTRTGVLL
jgi:hypothetical protein